MLTKWLSLALCLILLVPSAQAAQLLEDDTVSVAGAVAPSYAYSFTGASPELLLDDESSTFWSRPAGSAGTSADITLYTGQTTLSAIWLRNGNQTSEWDYNAYARPGIIKVEVTYLTHDVLYANSYRYAMTDLYQPNVYSQSWQGGYQCLQLPQPITGVQSVSLTVESIVEGVHWDRVCISDVLLAGTGTQSGSSGVIQETTFMPIETTLLMRLATRSGPSTRYEELGSYFKEGYDVTVLSLCYDDGGVPWVQVEFTYLNRLRRAYTGLKRVDVDEALLPREEWLADATLARKVTPRYGPGTDYAARNLELSAGLSGSVYAYENGWAQFEYYDTAKALYRRVWVQTGDLNIR
ncbi:MAG: hypothetical protein E7316_11075 [Clostridiales bacterium]|nr:hypothetical protein [Clostridiales bacterium]